MKIKFSKGHWIVFLACYIITSVYVVFKHSTDLNAISLYETTARHQRMLDGNSEFFNPWQYRVLGTYSAEYFYQTLHVVSDKITRIHAFLLFRIGQNILIFIALHFYLLALGIRNPWMIVFGSILTGFCMATSTFNSDLSFNTYFDILFYLIAAWLILTKKLVWIVPLTFFAALNRETSLLIPFMMLAPFIPGKLRNIPKTNLILSAIALIVFVMVFVSVRMYYGYQPAVGIHGFNSFTDYLKFNFSFLRLYPELIGTLTFIPFIVLLFFKRLPLILKQWFWLICPVWVVVHFMHSTVVETRLFLVPQVLILIPAFLWLVEHWYASENQALAG